MTSSFHFRFLVLMAVALLSACSSAVRAPAPVEDRTAMGRSSSPTQATPAAEVAKPMPGSENDGKPGYYTVQRGDTLTRIGLLAVAVDSLFEQLQRRAPGIRQAK